MKRIGDDGSADQCERGSELAVDLGEQDGRGRRCGAVKLGQPGQPLLISEGT